MTIAQAWRTIARAFDRASYGAKGSLAEFGLCYAVVQLVSDGALHNGQQVPMLRQVEALGADRGDTNLFFWPLGRRGARCRAVAAALLAQGAIEPEYINPTESWVASALLAQCAASLSPSTPSEA